MVSVNCPSCGAPVSFRAQHTLYAVCSACGTLLVRQDVDVQDLGKVASLQPDGTPLRLGTQGTYQGKTFELLGRIQIRTLEGFWNEWYLLYSDGREGWLGEAMGEYLVTFPQDEPDLPEFSEVSPGSVFTLAGRKLIVTQVSRTEVVSFEGELPFIMRAAYQLPSADLRGTDGQAATLDYSEEKPLLFMGEYRQASELQFRGLRLDDDEPSATPGVRVKSFKCPSCGAPHELKAGALTQVMVCPYCDAAIDTKDPQLAKLYQAQQAQEKVPAVIPLGSKGQFAGQTWECIGFMRRCVTVEGLAYRWSEYLLYERMHGYRWLTETDGHWVYLEPARGVPHFQNLDPAAPATAPVLYEGVTYKHFQRAEARVLYVAGEFYWRVKVGDLARTDDYVAPPRMLSAETSQEGFIWSQGRYLEPAEVWQAFQLPGAPPQRSATVAPAQPNPYLASRSSMWKTWGITAALGFLMMVGFAIKSQDPVKTFSFDYFKYEAERSHVSQPFKLEGRTSNVKLELQTDFSQRWAFFQLTLINTDTNVAWDTGQTVSYYTDSDGSYGSRENSVLLPSVPAGNYILRVEPQTGTGDNPEPNGDPSQADQRVFHYTIQIFRDVAEWGFYWPLVGFMLLPPLWVSWKASSFETRRWSESDYAPGGE